MIALEAKLHKYNIQIRGAESYVGTYKPNYFRSYIFKTIKEKTMPKRLGSWDSEDDVIAARKPKDNVAKKRRYWKENWGVDVPDSDNETFSQVSRRVGRVADILPCIGGRM